MGLTLLVAVLWGFAEATLFFIVPDVWLTWVALSDLPLALRACAATIGGAVVGGAVMYLWGRRDPARAAATVDAVPGISAAQLVEAEQALRERGWMPMFVGAIVAVPYKIYAIKSGTLNKGLLPFIAVSVFARAIRFVALACLVSVMSNAVPGLLWYRQAALLVIWAIVYVVYFRTRGW
jgi:membrane protein YqaA with SNARE-associated domain